MSDELFSLKMRASQGERHISGVEKILTEKQLSASLGTLLTRALKHAAGEPDFINFKVEKLNPDSILHIDALPVKTISAQTPEEGLSRMRGILDSIGIARSGEIVSLLRNLRGMRGAVLLDADTLERLEEDPRRGIRAMPSGRNPGSSGPRKTIFPKRSSSRQKWRMRPESPQNCAFPTIRTM